MLKTKLYTKTLSLTVCATITAITLLCIPGCSSLEASLDNVGVGIPEVLAGILPDDGYEPEPESDRD